MIDVKERTSTVDAKSLIEKLLANVAPADVQEMLQAIRTGRTKSKASMSLQMKGHVASVRKHVNGILIAIHKLQDLHEDISEQVWGTIEGELDKLCHANYREIALATPYVARISKGGRPPKQKAVVVEGTPRKVGRPKGSKNTK